jgi:hypothetical protein
MTQIVSLISAKKKNELEVSDDPWRKAFSKMIADEDVKPLAHLLRSGLPPPPWFSEELAELLHPIRPVLMGNDPDSKATRLDLKNADRLVFVRTDATRGKIETHAKRVAAGLAVMEEKTKGKKHKDAVTEVARHLGSFDLSYVEHSIRHAKSLPVALRGAARKLDEF